VSKNSGSGSARWAIPARVGPGYAAVMLGNQKLMWRAALMIALLMLSASSGGHGVFHVVARIAWIAFLLGLVYFAALGVRAVVRRGRAASS
jgi:hypothetical protein